jgi:alpha/beta hydrolase family protein
VRNNSQALSWGDCPAFATTPEDKKSYADPSAQCAYLEVPLDYAKPNDRTIKVGLLRIGSSYAEDFPHNVRAMILDGAIDPAQDPVTEHIDQGRGFQQAFDMFSAWCTGRADCALGEDTGQAVNTFHALVRPLIIQPAAVSDRHRRCGTAAGLFQGRRITAFTNEEERLQALRSAPRGCWRAGCENVEPSSKLIAMSYCKSVCEQSDRSRSRPPGSPADAYAGSQTSALSTLTTLSTVRPVYVRLSDGYDEHCYLPPYAHGSGLYR